MGLPSGCTGRWARAVRFRYLWRRVVIAPWDIDESRIGRCHRGPGIRTRRWVLHPPPNQLLVSPSSRRVRNIRIIDTSPDRQIRVVRVVRSGCLIRAISPNGRVPILYHLWLVVSDASRALPVIPQEERRGSCIVERFASHTIAVPCWRRIRVAGTHAIGNLKGTSSTVVAPNERLRGSWWLAISHAELCPAGLLHRNGPEKLARKHGCDLCRRLRLVTAACEWSDCRAGCAPRAWTLSYRLKDLIPSCARWVRPVDGTLSAGILITSTGDGHSWCRGEAKACYQHAAEMGSHRTNPATVIGRFSGVWT